jgi:glycosyltransferase involved in cell wall biosynthesis
MKTNICLILEGTYPYAHGGVSSWIHQLVTNLKDFSFSIVLLSATGDTIRTTKYEIPPNILEFKEEFIFEFADDRRSTHGSKEEGWKALRELYTKLGMEDFYDLEKFYDLLINKKTRRLNIHEIVYSRRGWRALIELYNTIAPDVSFIDFYWTMRFVHVPILNLFNIEMPDASLYHTICTGYAGLLAVIAKTSRKVPMLLTEHGIYTYERKIDISRATWIYSKEERTMRATKSLGFFKDFWIRKFDMLGRLTYHHADRIITLFEGNRRMQIDGGADPLKTMIIPNGVLLPESMHEKTRKREMKSVGFVGRVVSIKDVKTFIRAMKIVKGKIDNLVVYIMGSGDEELDYLEECRTLVKMLQLEEVITFTGIVDVREYYQKLDCMVLTSISEAQPLSILEAMSYGIPVVATDVGSCPDLILGKDDDDRQLLGAAGIITNVGSPHETANAVIKILENDEMRKGMSDVGMYRVKKHYSEHDMIESYREIYSLFLNRPAVRDKGLMPGAEEKWPE